MRAGLLFLSFIILTLLVVSSGQNNRKQTCSDNPARHSIILSNNIISIIPETRLFQKKLFTGIISFQNVDERHLVYAKSAGIDFTAIYLRSYKTKSINFTPSKKKLFSLKLCYNIEKEEDHYLTSYLNLIN